MATPTPIPEPVKIAIIQALACFDSISTVVAAIKTEYGLAVSPQAVEAHDPTKRAGAKLATKWRALFEETRATFIADTAAIPISHRATRLRALNRMAARAESQGNLALAANLHKQAAEEVGNAYTNKRELSGPNGSALPPTTIRIVAADDRSDDTTPA